LKKVCILICLSGDEKTVSSVEQLHPAASRGPRMIMDGIRGY